MRLENKIALITGAAAALPDDTMGFGPGDRDRVGPELIGEDQPSMALTISILCEDVFSTWMRFWPRTR